MQINISGTPDEIAKFIFNLQDGTVEDKKEVSDKEKFRGKLKQWLDRYPPQLKNIEFKTGTLKIACP